MEGNEELLGNGARPVSGKDGNEEFAASPLAQVEASEESLRVEISWRQVAKDDSMLQISSFAKRDPPEGRGGSPFQGGRTRELVKENKDTFSVPGEKLLKVKEIPG